MFNQVMAAISRVSTYIFRGSMWIGLAVNASELMVGWLDAKFKQRFTEIAKLQEQVSAIELSRYEQNNSSDSATSDQINQLSARISTLKLLNQSDLNHLGGSAVRTIVYSLGTIESFKSEPNPHVMVGIATAAMLDTYISMSQDASLARPTSSTRPGSRNS